jgi:kanamycin kinase
MSAWSGDRRWCPRRWWADLAIATWSSEWNYGPGWDGLLLDAYGIRPDPDRTRYYRLLWDLGP